MATPAPDIGRPAGRVRGNGLRLDGGILPRLEKNP